MGDASTFVRLRELSKVYGGRGRPTVHALEKIDFDIRAGEFVAVVGPSGCGKTTWLSMLAGLLTPTTGTVEIGDTRVTGPYSRLGVVFQKDVLLEWRTVLANIMLQAEIRRLDRGPLRRRALELLNRVGLAGFEHSYPAELSGGMRQRVSLCRALVHDPPLLLMDEPFAALDAFTRDDLSLDFQRLIHEEGKTVFFITHSIPEAVYLADRVVVMTNRPATIADVLRIDLPRPRPLAIRDTADFTAHTARVREVFEAQGVIRHA